MSQNYPPHPGGYQPPYVGPPAYLGYASPAPQSSGMNPWVAGLIGVIIGGMGAILLSFLLPLIFFGLMMGSGFDDGEFMDGPTRVTVSSDGSVSGTALAQALDDGGWYDDMSCPDTAKVATDVTTICTGTDGFDDLRVVVVFRGTEGRFSTADLFDSGPID